MGDCMGEKVSGVLKSVIGTFLRYNPFFNVFLGSRPSASLYRNYLHQMYLMARLAYQRPVRVVVADEIGLGKTVEAIRAIKHLMQVDGVRKVLIVVPPILLDQWIEKDLYNFGLRPVIVDRSNIEELLERARRGELEEGIFIGSIDRLKLSSLDDVESMRYPYFEFVSSVDWDLVIIDEAHKLSYLGSRPSLRYERIGIKICRNKAKHCLLLTATPHRGKTDDFMARIALLDKSLIPRPSELAKKIETLGLRTEVLRRITDVVFFKRMKEDVNRIEGRQVFKPAHQYPVLIHVPDELKKINEKILDFATLGLDRYYVDPKLRGIRELLRKLLMKRAMSSELALLNTFMRIGARRGGISDEELASLTARLEGYMTEEEESEQELDEEVLKFVEAVSSFVDPQRMENMRKELKALIREVREVIDEGKSPKVNAVADIVELALGRCTEELGENFRDMYGGRIIVFTEFKDSARQLFDQLDKILGERLGDVPYSVLTKADKVRHEYINAAKGGTELLRYLKVIPTGSGELIGLALLTSDSKRFLREFQKMLSDKRLATTVLISTDVAAEGLNMQAANIVVIYEVPWSPLKREQRIGRVWRLGQRRDVFIFDFHMGTDFEREILENYTVKIITIAEEAGYTTVHYKGLAFYIPQIVAEEESEYALRVVEMEKFTESTILENFAQALKKALGPQGLDVRVLGRELAKLASEIVRFTRQLRKELEDLSRFRADPKEVRREVKLLLGLNSDEEAIEVLLQIIRVASKLGLADVQDLGDVMYVNGVKASKQSIRDLVNVLAGLADWGAEDWVKPVVLLSGGRDEFDAAFLTLIIAEDSGNRILYAEPVLIVSSKDGVQALRGAELARELMSLVESSSTPEFEGKAFSALRGHYISAARTCAHLIEEIRKTVHEKPSQYISSSALAELRGLKNPEIIPDGQRPVIKLSENPLVVFLPAPYMSTAPESTDIKEETSPLPVKAVSPEKKEKVKIIAENIIKSFFESMGYKCVKRSEYSPYDFELYDQNGNLVSYVEVKGHETSEPIAELSENEFEFAKEHEDRYIVCIVTNVLTSPHIRCVPFKELKPVKTVFTPAYKYIYRSEE